MSSVPLKTQQYPSEIFKSEGYVVIREVIDQESIAQLSQQIQQSLYTSAIEMGCSLEEYLSAVSRWVAPSPITAGVTKSLLDKLSQTIETVLLDSVLLKKLNVISKNKYNCGKIPFHQDISYSKEAPYQLSAWLALHDTNEEKGPLEVIPGSHLRVIENAVDFWSVDYKPDARLEKNALKLPIKAGDMILFDSRLWHGSGKNHSSDDRFALVTRWSGISWNPPETIPSIEPMGFGMWTCGKTTEDLLKKGLEMIMNISKDDYLDILGSWIQFLQEGKVFPFKCNHEKSMRVLCNVRVLHQATIKHNGGDATGAVYKGLWKNLLFPLEKYLQQEKGLITKLNQRFSSSQRVVGKM